MLGRICPTTSTVRASVAFLEANTFLQIQTAQVHHHKERGDLQRFLGIQRSNKGKANRNTHVNEKMFRRMRGRKTVLIDLPDDVEDRRLDSLTPMQLRMEMLKKGINPYKEVTPRSWEESQSTLSSFGGVLDPYVQPDSKVEQLSSKDGWKHAYHSIFNGTRRIRKKEGYATFKPKEFGPTAEMIYVEGIKAIQERNKTKCHEYLTELAFVKMWKDVENGSIAWKLVEWLEPSKVISVRCGDQPYQSGNDIAQVMVRMHSKQILAVYDRFGHILLGSETEPKEVIEYVVFENHIASLSGKWRLHDRVHPSWSKPKDGLLRSNPDTYLTDEDTPGPVDLPLRIGELQKQKKEKEDEK